MVNGGYTQSNQRSININIYINGLILDVCTTLFTIIQVTRAELDDFKLGRAIPSCILEARPLREDCNYLLHEITLTGVKPPYNELTLRLYDSVPLNFSPKRGKFNHMHIATSCLANHTICKWRVVLNCSYLIYGSLVY